MTTHQPPGARRDSEEGLPLRNPSPNAVSLRHQLPTTATQFSFSHNNGALRMRACVFFHSVLQEELKLTLHQKDRNWGGRDPCPIMGSVNSGPRQDLQGPTVVLETRRHQTGEVTCLGAHDSPLNDPGLWPALPGSPWRPFPGPPWDRWSMELGCPPGCQPPGSDS